LVCRARITGTPHGIKEVGVEEDQTSGLKLTAEETRATTAAPFHRFDVNKADWHQYMPLWLLTSGRESRGSLSQAHPSFSNLVLHCFRPSVVRRGFRISSSGVLNVSLSFTFLFCFETMKCQPMIQNLKSHKTKKQRVSNLKPSFVSYRSMSRWLFMSSAF
jgi:hypothetical protein